MKTDNTFVIGITDGIITFIKTFDYETEKDEAQKALSYVSDKANFTGWYISQCNDWILAHAKDGERNLLIKLTNQ